MQRLWLIAVDGPIRGESFCLEPGQTVTLGPGHWDIGPEDAIGPFCFDGEALIVPAGGVGRHNLFPLRTGARLRPGDVLEIGAQMLLLSTDAPGWPGSAALLGPPDDAYEDDPESPDEDESAAPEDADASDEADPDPADLLEQDLLEALGIPGLGFLSPPVPIPRIFQSVYHDGPFPTCLLCDRELLTSGEQYMIEKIFRGDNVILECALCLDCAGDVNTELSEESRERLEAFGRELMHQSPTLQRCRRCDRERDEMAGFNIISSALTQSVLPQSWVLLCEACVEGMEELLSKKTRDVYRDFVDDNFPGIPSGIDAPRPVLL